MYNVEQLRAAAVDISDKLDRLGDDVIDVREYPREDESDGDEDKLFLDILCESDGSMFYITLNQDRPQATIRYPFDITHSIGNRLTTDELQELVSSSDRWEGNSSFEDSDEEDAARNLAGSILLNNTPTENLWDTRFYLAQYVSSPPVSYEEETSDEGLPTFFWALRNMFPIESTITLDELDERTQSVITAGDRGKRLVNTQIGVEREGDVIDYTVRSRLG